MWQWRVVFLQPKIRKMWGEEVWWVHSLLFIRQVDVGAELDVFERAFPAPHHTERAREHHVVSNRKLRWRHAEDRRQTTLTCLKILPPPPSPSSSHSPPVITEAGTVLVQSVSTDITFRHTIHLRMKYIMMYTHSFCYIFYQRFMVWWQLFNISGFQHCSIGVSGVCITPYWPVETPGRRRPGTERIWWWSCGSDCSRSATSSCCHWGPSSHQWAEPTGFAPPPDGLGWPPPVS